MNVPNKLQQKELEVNMEFLSDQGPARTQKPCCVFETEGISCKELLIRVLDG